MSLLTTLKIIDLLTQEPKTIDHLVIATGESERTVKRCIAEARELGADIKAFRAGRYEYRLTNKEAIERGPFRAWLYAEQSRAYGGAPLTDEQQALPL